MRVRSGLLWDTFNKIDWLNPNPQKIKAEIGKFQKRAQGPTGLKKVACPMP